ncbi:MAG TPA: PGPGW domain-containing protein [Rubrobacter sp.]|nr:PGPGW domain-containing protein [Rubrobacter sp.]
MPAAPREYIRRAVQKIREVWRHWLTFREIDAGHRYQARYHLHQRRTRRGLVSRYWKPVSLICGPILIFAGFLFIPTPGPSYLIIAIGMWLLAGEILALARIFDKVGVRLGRVWHRIKDLWHALHVVVKVMIVCALAILLIHTVYSLFDG